MRKPHEKKKTVRIGLRGEKIQVHWLAKTDPTTIARAAGPPQLRTAAGDHRGCSAQKRHPTTIGSDLITRVLVDRQGSLWAGTDGAGLQRYDPTTNRFIEIHQDPNDPASLSQDVIRTLYEDASGRLWVGLYLGGADLLRQPLHPFFYYTHRASDPTSPSDPSIASFLEDTEGRLWIATIDPRSPRTAIMLYGVPSGSKSSSSKLTVGCV